MRTENVSLAPSAARTESSAGLDAVSGFGRCRAAEFQLNVTAAATDAGDTLDVFVQTTIDGVNWIDIAHFTQVLGNGGAKRFIAKVSGELAETMFEVGSALAAGSVRNVLGDQYRVRYDVVDAGTDNASFTFSVAANFVP